MRFDLSQILPNASFQSARAGWESFARSADLAPASVVAPTTFTLSEPTLTLGSLKAALLEIGSTPSDENFALAEAFAKLGVPLTEENLAEGRAVMARQPDMSPVAFALAKTLDLPLTPPILKALASVVQGWQPGKALPTDVMRMLDLAPDVAADPADLAAHLARVLDRLGQSTEGRIARGEDSQGIIRSDIRANLMTLAQNSDDGHLSGAADSHASLIEGQQLLNQVSMAKFDPPVALYYAIPVQYGAQALPIEIQVWTRDVDDPPESELKTATYLRATIRIAPPRLGRIEVRLLGTWAGVLSCALGAEQPATHRLLKREADDLAEQLGKLGWQMTPPTVTLQTEFPPLWYGGDALCHPRARIDRQA